MAWGAKERDWLQLIFDIRSEIEENKNIIPQKRIADIQSYLDHDEYSMAFEYLYLEIMERKGSKLSLGADKVNELALFFNLDDENECMIDHEFWPKLQEYLRM